MLDFFDHFTEQPVFFLQMFLEGLYNGVDMTRYRGITFLCLFVVAVDIFEKHTEDIGVVLPQFLSLRKAFAANLTSACHIGVIFWNTEDIIEYLFMFSKEVSQCKVTAPGQPFLLLPFPQLSLQLLYLYKHH